MDNTQKQDDTLAPAEGLVIKPSAVERINVIRTQKNDAELMLRITVEGGGCSGFQYELTWDSVHNDGDNLFAQCVIIDDVSLSFLKGSSVEFVSGLMGEDFKILNPNAVSSCGCGTSFSI